MFRTGLVGYGGGPAIMTLFRHEAVVRYRWMDNDEFGEILALANTLPGPIATKMAAYMGYRLKGTLGALVAVLSHILPSTVLVVVLFGILYRYRDSPVAQSMVHAVDPVIVVLLGLLAYEFAARTKQGLGWVLAMVTWAVAFALLVLLKAPDAVVVLAFLVYGLFHFRVVRWWKRAARGGGPGGPGNSADPGPGGSGGRGNGSAPGDGDDQRPNHADNGDGGRAP
nr:chromate transporter [Alicyclobacillus sp. SP_1]